ncbi:MAG: hypothetical protein OER87_15910 [Gammaproteobacteria bacterium]|nr:hypothetical protein [Gammaproteobacteria bacterium]
MYDRNEYLEKLETMSFVDLKIESIGGYVLPGAPELVSSVSANQSTYDIELKLREDDFTADAWSCSWRDIAGLEEYVIVSVAKSGAEEL